MNHKLQSHLPDPDMQSAPAALLRAAQRALQIARQTATEYVVVRDGELVREIPPPVERTVRETEK